jgi:uncharacterized protein
MNPRPVVECRSSPGVVALRSQGGRTIGGYAVVFGKRSKNLGGFVEIVAAGALNRSRGNGWPNVLARYEHTDLIGTAAAGTLRLEIDRTGLAYSVDVPRSRDDVLELVERGDVRFSSFAFRVHSDDWSTTEQGYPLRTLLSVELVDVAPVVDPAYPDATAGLRSLAECTGTPLEEVRTLAGANRLRELLPSGPRRISPQDALARLNALDKPRMTGAQARAALDALDRRASR